MESKKSVEKITGDHLWTRFLSEDNEAHNVNTGYSGAHKSASSTDASCSGRQSALNASAWPRKRELFREFLVFQRKAAPLYRHITDHMTTPHQFCARYLSNFVSTGCPAIDAAMGGGFRKGVLSEVSGEASAGKTQLVLQTLLTRTTPVAYGGRGRKALVVYTEGRFPIKRMRQMCDVQIRKYKHHDEASVLTREIDSWIENCLVEECSDMDIFYSSTLHKKIPYWLERNSTIDLVIIDSIAALLTGEFEHTLRETVMRTEYLFSVATQLKGIAHQHRIAVVTVNHMVASSFNDDNANTGVRSSNDNNRNMAHTSLHSDARQTTSGLRSALGLGWSYCCTARVSLKRSHGPGKSSRSILTLIDDSTVANKVKEIMEATHSGGSPKIPSSSSTSVSKSTGELVVDFSPTSNIESCFYEISTQGIFGLVTL